MRNYKKKDKQTNPSLAGEQNMSDEYIDNHQDKENDGLMANIAELFTVSCEQSKKKKGTNWTAEDLEQRIIDYFWFCDEKMLKPSKSGLQLFLGCSRSQYYDWIAKPERYGEISDICARASFAIENQYINRGEKYPTMNVFLLKTNHEYIETSKMDLTSNGQTITNGEEVKDLVSKLGLDK